MYDAKSVSRLGNLLADLTVRAIALWAMAELDECLAVLRDWEGYPAPVFMYGFDGSVPLDRRKQVEGIRQWLDPFVSNAHRILPELVTGKVYPEQYKDIMEMARVAPALDYFSAPFNCFGHALDIYMTNLDYVWQTYWDVKTALRTGDARCESFVGRSLQELKGIVPVLAAGLDEPVEARIARSIEIAVSLGQVAQRRPSDPLGPEIPPPLIDHVLGAARFFK